MSTTRWLAATAALVVAASLGALCTSSGSTQAGWQEELTLSVPDVQSDSFGLTVTDTTNSVDHRQVATTDIANEPAMTLKNLSQTHRSWIDVLSAKATIPASNTTSSLLSNVRLSHDPTTTDCLSGASGSVYWPVNSGNAVVAGTTYNRTWSEVPGDDLAPGQTKSLCPVVTRSGTDASFLLSHAGRQLDIETKIRQRAQGPGTWSSTTSTLTSRYQVKLPPPTRPSSDGVVCARVNISDDRTSSGLYGRLYWSWPFSANAATTTTPGVDRFAVIRSTDGVTWSPLVKTLYQTPGIGYETDGDTRASERINDSYLAADAPTPVFLSVRAYLYPGTDVYVDADWMVQASEGDTQIHDYFTCRTGGAATATSAGLTNASSAPVGLG